MKYSMAFSSRQCMFLSAILMLVLTGASFAYSYQDVNPYNKIKFNEVCSNNVIVVLDEESGLVCDYVELYNAGNSTISLDNLYLSDDEYDLAKLRIEGVSVESGELALIALDDDKAGFGVSKNGETLYLSDKSGNIIDTIDVPKLPANVAYSYSSETNSWDLYTCTPGRMNDGAAVEYINLSAPVFSHASGFYDDEFMLEIEVDEGTAVYYTTDGRRPDENSELYQGAILVTNVCDSPNTWHSIENLMRLNTNHWEENVDKCVVIRAVAVDSEGRKSSETVASYFVGMDEYKDKAVISLVPDYDEFFGEGGIYTAGQDSDNPVYMQRGPASEREAVLEYFEGNDRYFSQKIGVRIFGGSSRAGIQKRLTLFARKEYSGYDFIDYAFPDRYKYKKLALRTGFANMLAQELMRGTDVLTVESVPVTMFLDGELYGDTYLQTKLCAEYISKQYGVDKDNIILIKNSSVEEGSEEEIELFNELISYLGETDFADMDNYMALGEIMDIQSYIEFACANLFLANMDYSELHNFAIWRTREDDGSEYGDCRWRFAMYDLDSLDCNWLMLEEWNVESISEIDSFTAHAFTNGDYCFKDSLTYGALRKNSDFAEQFVLTYSDMLNTRFSKERIQTLLEKFGETLDWNYGFFIDRNENVRRHIAGEFELSGDTAVVNISVENPEGGNIRVNTCLLDNGTAEWSGEYFMEFPIELEAVACTGYEFAGWSGDMDTEAEVLNVEIDREVINLHAVFKKTDEK